MLGPTTAVGLVIALGAATLSAAALQTLDVDALVRRHYPIERLHPEEEIDRRQCVAVKSADARGVPTTIVAAYTDLEEAVLRVLTRGADGQYRITYETPPDLRIGAYGWCDVELIDVDGDGETDVHLSVGLGTRAYSNDWVFKWSSSRLTPLTWSGTDVPSLSRLFQAGFVDVHHDGTLQIVSANENYSRDAKPPTVAPFILHRLGPNGYEVERPVLLVRRTDPEDWDFLRTMEFVLPIGSDGRYRLRLINGDVSGKRRVTGGTLILNGKTIAANAQINSKVEFLEVPLGSTLPVDNVLRVDVQGPTDAFVTIIVEEIDAKVKGAK